MAKQRIRQLRATELKLLQERTKLQRRIEDSLSGAGWAPEKVQQLNREQDELEADLANVRAELRQLERAEPLPGED
jgi:flagellar motility protein MotE (MotC chaperone)